MTNKSFKKCCNWIALISLLTAAAAHGTEPKPEADPNGAAADISVSPRDEFITLRIPLDSERFGNVPVALVNDEPITIDEFTAFKSASGATDEDDASTEKKTADLEILDRLVVSRLVADEARVIGLDETEDYRIQREDFITQLLQKELIIRHLEDLEADSEDVREVYEQISREVLLDSITFEAGPEAQRFTVKIKEGEDFDLLAAESVEKGMAILETAEEYNKLKDLRQQVAQQAYSMAVGEVSNVFRTEDGFLIFRLADSRFVEDPSVEQEATQIVLSTLRQQKAMEFVNNLADTYFTIDQELYESLDFSQDLDTLVKDNRALAVAKDDASIIISVANLAAKLKMEFFHGIEKAKNTATLEKRKERVFSNMLFLYTSKWEAASLGLRQDPEIISKIDEFERSTLFNSFMGKVIIPDIKLTADEVRSHYEEHLADYSSPTMLNIKSLIFDNRQDAQNSLEKLRKGADFKWVSANATGFVSPDTEGVLLFDQTLLSLTALPHDLQHMVDQASAGSSLLYVPADGQFSYVLLVEDVFPPQPQPFDDVKDEVAKVVFNMKSQELLDEYAAQLMEAYETRIFVVEDVQ